MCKKLICLTSFVLVLVAITTAVNEQVDNLVLNPSFEEDEAILDDPAWEQWCTWNPAEGAGSNANIVDTDAVDGARSLLIEPIGVQNWHFIVLYMPIPVDVGASYTAGFWAKAAEPRALGVQFKATDNTVSWGYTDFRLTTEWAEYSLTADALNAEAKLEFMCAGVEVAFSLDSVSVYKVADAPTDGPAANLALNPSFEEDEVVLDDPTWYSWCTWNPAEGAGSNATIVDTEAVDGTRSLRVEPVGTESDHFIVANISFPLEFGADFTITFWAKAEAPRPLTASFKAADNSVSWGFADFELTTEWAEYSLTSAAESDAGKIEFLCAGSEIPFWIDAVSVYKTEDGPPPVTIPVDPNSDLAAANELAQPGDTVEFAAGTYYITSQIEVKDGVTYKGAGPGLTIIDGNDTTRAFAAWGDRGVTSGQVDANGVNVPNTTGPKGWVIEGMTIQNCASDDENRNDILSGARDLLNNYTGTPYTLATAQEENGGIMNNPEWFDILSGGADDDLTDAELQAYLDANPVGSAGHLFVNDDKRDDGGAVCILNGAAGTIVNCAFSNNTAVDDGGAIMVDGVGLDVAIDNCAFDLNTCGDVGGAVKLSGTASNSTVTGCSFTDNSAPEDDGGAIIMDGADSTYTLTGCTFTGCSALDDGGAIYASADNSTYVWTDCTFIGNYVTDSGADGGAVRYAPDRAEMTVMNCSFIGNGKDPNGTPVGDDGGAWKTDDDDAGPVTFMNCLFADNASKDDRILEVKGGSAILNCTFIGNVAGDEALIAVRGQAWDSTGDGETDVTTDDSIISNCLFINNTLLSNKQVIGDTRDDVFAPTVINCLFFGNLDQNGDTAINADNNSVEVGTIDVSAVTDAAQIVVDPAGDYHLTAGSPAIDASDPATATDSDIEGTAAVGVRDVGAYEYVAP